MSRFPFAILALAVVSLAPLNARSAPPARLQPVIAARSWIGTPVTAAGLAGNVVVLDVFTVDCSNCQNVVPTLRDLNARDRSRGLRVVGIHAPETPVERDRTYVEQSLKRQGISWPVAIDNSFVLWNTYGVTAWPTQLVFDRHGRLRATVVGDSQDAAVRATVEALLAER